MEKIIYISNKLISQLRLYFYSVVFVFFAMNVSQHVSTMYSTFHKCMKLRTSKKKLRNKYFHFQFHPFSVFETSIDRAKEGLEGKQFRKEEQVEELREGPQLRSSSFEESRKFPSTNGRPSFSGNRTLKLGSSCVAVCVGVVAQLFLHLLLRSALTAAQEGSTL